MTLDAVRTVRAIRGIELTSESAGEMTALHFDTGADVEADPLLLTLNDGIERASLPEFYVSISRTGDRT